MLQVAPQRTLSGTHNVLIIIMTPGESFIIRAFEHLNVLLQKSRSQKNRPVLLMFRLVRMKDFTSVEITSCSLLKVGSSNKKGIQHNVHADCLGDSPSVALSKSDGTRSEYTILHCILYLRTSTVITAAVTKL
jgi:hypothetical protein